MARQRMKKEESMMGRNKKAAVLLIVVMIAQMLAGIPAVFAGTTAAQPYKTLSDGSILYGFKADNVEETGDWTRGGGGICLAGGSRGYNGVTGSTVTAYFHVEAAGNYEILLLNGYSSAACQANVNDGADITVPASTQDTANYTEIGTSVFPASAGIAALSAGTNKVKVTVTDGQVRFDAILLKPVQDGGDPEPSASSPTDPTGEPSVPPTIEPSSPVTGEVTPLIDEDFEELTEGTYTGADFAVAPNAAASPRSTAVVTQEDANKFLRVTALTDYATFKTKSFDNITGEDLVISFRFRIHEQKKSGMMLLTRNAANEVVGHIDLLYNAVNARSNEGSYPLSATPAEVGSWYKIVMKFNTTTGTYDVYLCDKDGALINSLSGLGFRGNNGTIATKALNTFEMGGFSKGNVIDFDDFYAADDPDYEMPEATPTPSPSPSIEPSAAPSARPTGYPEEWGDDFVVFDDASTSFKLEYPQGVDGISGGSSLGPAHTYANSTTAEGTFTLSNVPNGLYEAYVRVPLVHSNNTNAQYYTVTDSLGYTSRLVLNIMATQNFTDNQDFVTKGESATGVKSLSWHKLEGQFIFFSALAGKSITGIDVEHAMENEQGGLLGNFRVDQVVLVKVAELPDVSAAIDVKIAGKNKPGSTLTGSYGFIDGTDKAEAASEYKWFAKDTANAAWTEVASGTTTAAEGSTYTLKNNERFAKFEITPKTASTTGTSVSAEFSVTQEDAAPQAHDVAIEGVPNLQAQLTGTYTYQDINGDLEGSSRYQWLTSSDRFADAGTWTVLEEGTCNAETPILYTIPATVAVGSYIRLAVTPVNTESTLNTGETIYSDPIGPVENVNLKPEVKELGYEGQAVNAQGLLGLAIGGQAEMKYTYTNPLGTAEDPDAAQIQWYRGDTQVGPWTAIEGATGRTYTAVEADSGKYIKYTIIPSDTNGISGESTDSPAYLVKWKLTFVDEFDDYEADDGFDTTFMQKWAPLTQEAILGNRDGKPAVQVRVPDNVSVHDGSFRILTKKEHLEKYNGLSPEHEWTTGNVKSRQHVGPYGYYETQMKFAPAGGLNESFWWIIEEQNEPGDFAELDFCEGHYPYEVATNLHRRVPNPSSPDGWDQLANGFRTTRLEKSQQKRLRITSIKSAGI